MYTNPIVLRDLTLPLSARKAKHAGPCGPYFLSPVGDRDGSKAGGWGEYQHAEGELGRTLWRLRAEDANPILREAGNYRVSRVTGYCGLEGGDSWVPLVVRLPHGRGFLAATSLGVGMCVSVDAGIHDTAEGAAWAAHSLAERTAELGKEGYEELQHEMELEEAAELPEDLREN